MGPTELAVVAIILGVVVVLLPSKKRWRPEEWARDVGLTVTQRNEAFVRSYIRRTRILRTAGGVAGLVAAAVYTAITEEEPPEPFDFSLFNGLVGYLIGAVAAELTFARPAANVPAASLEPREVAAYLPSAVRTTLRISAAVGLVLVPLFLVLPHRESEMARVEMLPAAILIAMILVVLAGVEILQRFIVARPQPAVDDDLLRADDAVRSVSVHALAGAGIALELVIVSVELAAIATVSDIQILRWTVPWIALVTFLSALAAWMHVTHPSRWRVRRLPHGATA